MREREGGAGMRAGFVKITFDGLFRPKAFYDSMILDVFLLGFTAEAVILLLSFNFGGSSLSSVLLIRLLCFLPPVIVLSSLPHLYIHCLSLHSHNLREFTKREKACKQHHETETHHSELLSVQKIDDE